MRGHMVRTTAERRERAKNFIVSSFMILMNQFLPSVIPLSIENWNVESKNEFISRSNSSEAEVGNIFYKIFDGVFDKTTG